MKSVHWEPLFYRKETEKPDRKPGWKKQNYRTRTKLYYGKKKLSPEAVSFKYAELDELTFYAAHELIKAIYVGAPDKSSGRRRQSVYIEYDLIGFIPLDELMKQETA